MLSPSYPPQSPSQIRKLGVSFEGSAGWTTRQRWRASSPRRRRSCRPLRAWPCRPPPGAPRSHPGCRPTPRQEAVLQAAAVRPEHSKQEALTSTAAGFVDSISTRSRRRRPKRATSTSAAAGQHARIQDLPLMRRTPPPPFISSSGSLSPCIQVRPHFGRRSAIELKALHNSRWRTGSKLMCSCTYFLILKLEIVICKMFNVLVKFYIRSRLFARCVMCCIISIEDAPTVSVQLLLPIAFEQLQRGAPSLMFVHVNNNLSLNLRIRSKVVIRSK
ncbi:uncharacterized protein LOC120645035 isoform X1 [Panicum virgatum]|uniref:uncharacterized protein LOC120645035 isoform X1 n=2 Tax=Panicum virgatum TaxID=38727 RepID=UPI0019D571E7|nr:uncharacterized protein LOC120645035 isoform X1 [Panicum virgatum]